MNDEAFMQLAVAAARDALGAGQPPFGACVVRDGEVVARAHNLVWQGQDVTAHAEVTAIRAACARLGTLDLSGCAVYSTCEPCPMCFTACHDARVARIVFGSRLQDAATFGYLGLQVPIEILLRGVVRPLEVRGDVLREPCLELFRVARGVETRPAAPGEAAPARCLHHLFEEQVARRPQAPALSWQGASWTYQELDARANRLANHLRSLGAGPETLVGLAVPRSADTVVGILGILKAGAAYVHLDPSHPRERLLHLLRDSSAPILVTHREVRDKLTGVSPTWVLLDADADALAAREESRPDAAVRPEHLCYVMYTSGSTGQPKGVMVTHANVARLFTAMAGHVEFDPADTWTAAHSASFGFSVWEIWGALAHGARLLVVPEELNHSPEAFHDLVCRERVTVLSQTPTAFRMFDWADEGSRSALRPSLRLIVFSGEALRPGLLKSWIARNGDDEPALVNTYAITESSGQILCRRVRAADLSTPDRSLIGRPLSDVDVHLLDADSRPVVHGSVGELYIGGPAVARGYLGRPELTEARFVPDPFSGRAGARLYRTGDLARRLPDGEIEFSGRADSQVKVRGFRIEPAEVEGCLRDHPALRDAVLGVAGADAEGESQLVAYVVPRADTLSPATVAGASPDSPADGPELWPSLGQHNVYDDLLYYLMDQDLARQQLFGAMLARHAPGRVIADVGTGSEAVLARLCVEAGARKVYAIELLPEVARAARAHVEKLGLQGRIEVLAGDARTLQFPEQVDLLVTRVMGNIGSSDGIVPILNGARRWLKPGGTVLPSRCVTRVAVVSLPEALRRQPRFTRLASYYAEKLFEQTGSPFDVRLCVRNIPASSVVSNVATFEDLDFSGPVQPAHQGSAEFEITADGRIDGFLLWLTNESGEGEVANYLESQAAWLPVFFPAFDPAVAVAAGDVVRAEWSCRPSANGVNPDYTVRGELLHRAGGRTPFAFTSPHQAAGYKQTPFYQRLFTGGHQPVRRSVTALELKDHVRERLPEYMVPSRFVFLEQLPVLPSGKVDRNALPALGGAAREGGVPYVAPRNPTEEKLAALWAELLGRDGIGVHEEFFDLGGHSLLAMRVVSELRALFGVELPVRTVFEAPTVERLAARVLQAQAAGGGPTSGRRPLSFAQERLWFLHQLDPDNRARNVPTAARLRGPVRTQLLRRALEALVARHEVLRTTYPAVDGSPLQEVNEPRRVDLRLVDLSAFPRAEQEARAHRAIVAETQRPFDLSRDLMMRATLLTLDSEEHVLLLVTHRIASDRWSGDVLLRETAALYRALVADQPAPLPQPALQYAEFADRQRQRLAGEAAAPLLGYWKERFARLPPPLELPTDRPRPPLRIGRGGRAYRELPPDLAQSLRELSRRQGVGLGVALLAGFQALLSRYTGLEDVVVGWHVPGRSGAEQDGVVGCYGNTVPLRTDLSGDPTFRELLGRVRERTEADFSHQEFPLEKLLRELPLPRSLSHTPLFQATFTFQEEPAPQPPGPGLTLLPLEVDGETAEVDLALHAVERPTGLGLTLEYDADLFDGTTAGRMLGHLETLLSGAAGDADAALSALPLLTAAEHEQLALWNDTRRAYPPDQSVAQVFEAQARLRPGAVAAVAPGLVLTYAELNCCANQLAHYLIRLGVRPGATVGVCLERSLEAVVSLLAVLKAGGAYLPLYPAERPDRLGTLAREAGLKVVLTREGRWAGPPCPGLLVVSVDADSELIDRESENDPAPSAGPDDMAAVLFTSGSTGAVKGVRLSHRAVVRQARGCEPACVGPDEVLLHWSRLSSAASAFEIWGALLNGARLAILPGGALSPEFLADALRGYRVTTLRLPAGVFPLFVDHHLPALTGLRQLLVAGGVPSVAHLQRALQGARDCRIINAYTFAEGGGLTCCFPVTDPGVLGTTVPIGRPTTNATAHVLDRHRNPVPVGVPGELYVGGDGVALGYLNAPGLTPETFFPDSFRATPGARLSRTGDRARRLADGTIELLGREGCEVKVKGFVVDAARVEALLARHPGVAQAAVLSRECGKGEERLLAFIIRRKGHSESGYELRGSLEGDLPAYALPGGWVFLENFPMTPAGQIDRQVLRGLNLRWDEPAGGYVAPGDTLQLMLTELWEDLLGVRPVGIRDDFFELGGDSLRAARMAARVEELWGRKIPLPALFAEPTVDHLCLVLLEQEERRQTAPLVTVQAGGGRVPFFLQHGDVLGGGLYCRGLARQLASDQPFYVLQPHGFAEARVPSTIPGMAADHLEVLRAFRPEGPYLLGGYCNGALEIFEMAQRLLAQGQEVDLLVLIDPPAINDRAVLPAWAPGRDPWSWADWCPEQMTPRRKREFLLTHYRSACARYLPARYPGRLVILRSRATVGEGPDPTLGWQAVSASLETHLLPGDHGTVLTSHVAVLAEHLQACLDGAQRGTVGSTAERNGGGPATASAGRILPRGRPA